MRSQHAHAPGNIFHGDSYSIGQIAAMWSRPTVFVRQMIAEGRLVTDARGLVTNTELRRFYADSGELLNV